MEKTTDAPVLAKKGTFPASVVQIINNNRLAINKGKDDGIRLGQRMLVYELSTDEIIDPNTGESLGYLEIVKGTGKVINIQEKMSIIESDQTRLIKRTYHPQTSRFYNYTSIPSEEIEEQVIIPFEDVKIGDQVKPI